MNAENPADAVTEQGDARRKRIEVARNLIAEEVSEQPGWTPTSIAFVLDDAGLLADPVDRDEWLTKFREAQAEVGQVRQVCREVDGQRERAEAERDHYHARLDALLATMGETLEEGEKPGSYWAKWHMKHCAAAEAAQQLAAERDAAKETAALAEKDRRAYHRDALRAEAEVAELRATIDRVREVHRPHACTGYPDCMILFGGKCAHDNHCNHCRKTWPCPTIRALDGAGEQQ